MTDKNNTFDRALDIISELAISFKQHQHVDPHVTIFGSARLEEGNPYYDDTVKLAKILSDAGIPIMSGGGPGIMEAANLGAMSGDSKSFAASIKLPNEQGANNYIDIHSEHKYFMIRKWMLMSKAVGIVCAAGGFGTVDELSEMLTLIQTKKLKPVPIVLMGSDFWKGFDDMCRNSMLPAGVISESDINLYKIVDTPEEAAEYLLSTIELI